MAFLEFMLATATVVPCHGSWYCSHSWHSIDSMNSIATLQQYPFLTILQLFNIVSTFCGFGLFLSFFYSICDGGLLHQDLDTSDHWTPPPSQYISFHCSHDHFSVTFIPSHRIEFNCGTQSNATMLQRFWKIVAATTTYPQRQQTLCIYVPRNRYINKVEFWNRIFTASKKTTKLYHQEQNVPLNIRVLNNHTLVQLLSDILLINLHFIN